MHEQFTKLSLKPRLASPKQKPIRRLSSTPPSIDTQQITPWLQDQSSISPANKVYSSTSSPQKSNHFPSKPLFNSSKFKQKSTPKTNLNSSISFKMKKIYNLDHLQNMNHLQFRKLGTVISYKSASIEYESSKSLEEGREAREKRRRMQSVLRYESEDGKQGLRRFKISTKYGRQWFNLSKLPKNQSLVVSSGGWKKLKTLDYSDITSHNFVAKRKLFS